DSSDDTQLKEDVLRMIEAGFSENSIEKLLKQYFALRNAEIPLSLYDKKQEIKFGTAGIRGILSEEFNFLDVSIIIQAISNAINDIASRQGIKEKDIKVVVGWDSRFLSKQFAEIVSNIFAANGIEVIISSDDVPTPTISYFTRKNKLTLSVNITASHNTKEYNGFKITLGDGGLAGTDVTSSIESEIKNIQNQLSEGIPLNKIIKITKDSSNIKSVDMQEEFIDAFIGMITKISGIANFKDLESFKEKSSKWTVIVDPKNGTTKKYYPKILEYLGFNVVMINDTRDVTFAGQKPEPSAANVKQLIKMVQDKANGGVINLLGISTDVDGDRFGVVAQDGKYITANEIGLILEQSRIERELNLLIDKVVNGELPLADFLNKKIIIARNLATTHIVDYLAKYMATEIFTKRFSELQKIASKQNIDLNIDNLVNNVEVQEVNVGFKYMSALKHEAENDGDLFLLAIESSGGISIAEWIYDKCGFLANIMLLISLVNEDKQPQDILDNIYNELGYFPAYKESAVRFRTIVEKEQPNLSINEIKQEAQRREDVFKNWVETATVEDINKLIDGAGENIIVTDIEKTGEDTLENLKVKFSDNSWLVLRLSGTEPLVRVIVETKDKQLCEKLSKIGEEIVKGKFKEIKSLGKYSQVEIATSQDKIVLELFRQTIINSIESLQRIVLSLIFKENIEYTMVSKADDLARIKRAEELSKIGVKVNLILLGNTNLVQETTTRLTTDSNKLAFGLMGKVNDKLTVYSYEQIPGQNISEQESLIAMLRYLNSNTNYSMKILDLSSQIDNISVSDVEEVSRQMFTTIGVDKAAISLFADVMKQKIKKTNDMFIKPSVVASNITSAQIDTYGQADISRALEQGVTTIIVSVDNQLLDTKNKEIQQILQMAHQNGLKVMFNYTINLETENIDSLIKWGRQLNKNLSAFKSNGGIDGVKLDLSKNGELASSFQMISLLSNLSKIVNEQNIDSFLAVKMPATISATEYGTIFADNNIKLVVDYNSDFQKQNISSVKSEDIIIDITTDENGTVNQSKLIDIFENNKVSMISFDSSILDAIETTNGKFSFREMTIGKLITSIFETTPQGQTIKGINKGRLFIADRAVILNESQIYELYNMYITADSSVDKLNSLLSMTFKQNISKYELEGIIRGILEASELNNLNMKDIVFDNAEYNNLLMKALVDYRVTSNKNTSFKYDSKTNIEDVLQSNMFREEYKSKINEIYSILNGQYKDKDDTVISILSSLSNDSSLNQIEKTKVLEALLLMLLGYVQQENIKIGAKNISNISNIKAILSAA
ncbi:MAG: hypothetical protein PHT81_05930, partial [Endomicrobiaceae bacterium]|nr:hypothetical protein [Endomicrobiaceae bacterium]